MVRKTEATPCFLGIQGLLQELGAYLTVGRSEGVMKYGKPLQRGRKEADTEEDLAQSNNADGSWKLTRKLLRLLRISEKHSHSLRAQQPHGWSPRAPQGAAVRLSSAHVSGCSCQWRIQLLFLFRLPNLQQLPLIGSSTSQGREF